MSERDDDSSTEIAQRVPSGLPGLDAILRGGFLRGGVYMILAKPGSGKTVLGNQICFRHAAAGGRALVVTLLTESHARMIAQLRTFSFFDPARLGAEVSYVAGYTTLETQKLKGLLDLLRKGVRDHNATLLVIDGLVTAGSLAESEIDTKKFIHELQVFVELVGCTTLLLTGTASMSEQYALRTMVDGLFELQLETMGMEATRTLEVTKFRGSETLLGRHLFEISDEGLAIYPRFESRGNASATPQALAETSRSSFGIKGFDAMLGGGLRGGSITMMLGAPGSGKTLLGLSLLAAGARAGERGLYFGFFETPADLTRRADALGMSLSDHVASGLIDVVWQPRLDGIADALGEKLLAAIRERGIRRLVIDGLGGFRDTLVYPDRARRFFGALCDELRAMGVVTVLSDETAALSDVELPEHGLTAMVDNVVCLRHAHVGAQLHQLVSVSKMREGGGDSSVRELTIGPRGFVVSPASKAIESILAGRPARTSSRGRSARLPKKDVKRRGR